VLLELYSTANSTNNIVGLSTERTGRGLYLWRLASLRSL